MIDVDVGIRIGVPKGVAIGTTANGVGGTGIVTGAAAMVGAKGAEKGTTPTGAVMGVMTGTVRLDTSVKVACFTAPTVPFPLVPLYGVAFTVCMVPSDDVAKTGHAVNLEASSPHKAKGAEFSCRV